MGCKILTFFIESLSRVERAGKNLDCTVVMTSSTVFLKHIPFSALMISIPVLPKVATFNESLTFSYVTEV